MSSCYIVGGGNKCDIPVDSFIIGTNMHYRGSNILVAVDEPIVKQLLENDIAGLNYQPIILNAKVGQYYSDSVRCIQFDYQKYYNVGSLSSGLLAIAFANFLNFSTINLVGFDKLLKEHSSKFSAIKQNNRNYIKYDSSNNYTVC